jgi:hypothetical protein
MSEEDETLLDLGDLDSLTLDDVDEAPDFMCPPSGKYYLGISDASIQKKEADGETKQSIRIIFFIRETLELNNQEDDLVPNGTLFSESFQGTKKGLEFFKSRARKLLGADIDGISIGDMMDFLPKQFGADGDKKIATVLKKIISKTDTGEFENPRFQKMDVVEA